MSNISELFPIIKNKLVEIAIGDEYEQVVNNDANINMQSVVVGYPIEIYGDFIAVKTMFLDDKNVIQRDNLIYINSMQIKLITEINSNGSLDNSMMSVLDVNLIKRKLGLYGDKK